MTSSELTKELRMILEEELSLTLELTEIAQEKLLRLSDSDVKALKTYCRGKRMRRQGFRTRKHSGLRLPLSLPVS